MGTRKPAFLIYALIMAMSVSLSSYVMLAEDAVKLTCALLTPCRREITLSSLATQAAHSISSIFRDISVIYITFEIVTNRRSNIPLLLRNSYIMLLLPFP